MTQARRPGSTGTYQRMLRWYPPAWRNRYGEELEALMEDSYESPRHVPGRDRLGLVRAGLLERLRVRGPCSPVDRVRDGSILVLLGWSLFLVAGVAFGKFSDRWRAGTLHSGRWLATTGFDTALAMGAAGSALVVVAAVLVGPSFARFVREGGWEQVRRPVVRALAAVTARLILLAALGDWAHHLSATDRNGGLPLYGAAFVLVGLVFVATVGLAMAGAVAVARRTSLSRRALRLVGLMAVVLTVVMTLLLAGMAAWWGAEASGAPRVILDGMGNGVPYLSNTVPPTLLGAGSLMLLGLGFGAVGSLRVVRSLPKLGPTG